MWTVSLDPSPESGYAPADVVIDAQPDATVGDLATALGKHLSGGRDGALVGPVEDGEPWPAARALTECALRSGDVLPVVSLPRGWLQRPARPAKHRGVLRVVAGPDAGRSQVITTERVSIGRDPHATLVLNDPLVSRRHTTVVLGTTATVIDEGSANGTIVDGNPITAPTEVEWGRPFRIGDSALTVEPSGPAAVSVAEVLRPPRFGEPLAEGVREVAAPPTPPRPSPLQWAMFALPLVLGGAMLMQARSTYALAYMIGYPVVMVASYFTQRRRQRKEHQRELAIWRTDVDATLDELDVAAAAQRTRAGRDHPELRTLAARVQLRGRSLWERADTDTDFLHARVGTGPVAAALTAEVKSGGDREAAAAAREDIALRAVLDELAVPVTVAAEDLVAIAGPAPRVDAVARALLARLACDHSPAQLSVTAALGRTRAHHEAWLRWLPHAARRTTGAAPVAIGAPDATRLVEGLLAEDDARGVTLCLVDADAGLPRRLIEAAVASDAVTSGRLRLVWLGDHPDTVPAATTVLIDLTASVPAPNAVRAATRPNRPEPRPVAMLAHRARGGVALLTAVDELGLDDAWRLARAMHGCVDASAVIPADTALPDTIRLPGLVADLRDADDAAGIRARWAARRGLRAQIGVGGAGNTVSLDLREDGPHGLVAGTTGSGKSELLQSLIASLALNNPPERITFLLVDYKGGAAFRECADLPHTVGYITDLSPALVQRALTSLGAEITAREQLLERYAAKDLRALERDHPEIAPPSLLICVDEFAALTAEVPDFVDGVVNIAQRGRSLGMHLLLATQRPAGVITANVRANTDLRIALRVSSTDDSNDVIDSPDAARITRRTPGRAWIRRTGHGTAELVQAAWVGAHAPRPGKQAAVTVRPFSAAVAAAAEAAPTELDPRTDLERLVTAVGAAFALSGRARPAKPWLPALPAEVLLDAAGDGGVRLAGADGATSVPRRSGAIPIGIVDRPAEQAQEPAVLDFGRAGHLLAYGASGTGKTELLRSVAVAAMLTEPQPPSVYGIDFGGGALGMLATLPVVGAVIGESELERVMRLLRMLRGAVTDRNRLLASRGAADLDALTAAGVDVPRVYVLVDNLPSLLDTLEAGGSARRQHAEILTSVLQDGRRVGVHVIATAPRRTGVGSGMQAAFGQRLVLRMPTDDDYSMIGVPGGVLDADSPAGRALLGRHEVQVATVGGAGTPAQAERLAELAATIDAPRAVGVPGMPTRLPQTLLPAPARDDLAFAVEADYVAPVSAPLTRGPLLVAGRAASGRSSLLAGLAGLARRADEPPAETILIGPRAGEHADAFDTVLADPSAVLDWLPDWTAKAEADPQAWRLVCLDDMHVWERAWETPCVAHDAVAALAELAARASALGVALVVATDSDDARTRQHVPGVVAAVRRARHGVLLSPEMPDGSLLGVSVPMQTTEPMAGRGRGLLCEGGTCRVVQVVSFAASNAERSEADL